MEVLNVFLAVLVALGSALAQSDVEEGPTEYQEAADSALVVLTTEDNRFKEIANDAVVELQDIVNLLTLAEQNARYSIMHVANFNNANAASALEEMLPETRTDSCVQNPDGVKDITAATGLGMVQCFTDRVSKAQDILNDTQSLNTQAAAIMPRAMLEIENCNRGDDPLACIESQVDTALNATATLEEEIVNNVATGKFLLSKLHYNLELCLGKIVEAFITGVSKYANVEMDCVLNGA